MDQGNKPKTHSSICGVIHWASGQESKARITLTIEDGSQFVANSSVLGISRLPGKLQHMGIYPGILRRPSWLGPTQPAPSTFPPSQVSQAFVLSKFRGFHLFTLVNLFAGPTSTIIDLCSSGGDSEEAQDVDCSICPAWW